MTNCDGIRHAQRVTWAGHGEWDSVIVGCPVGAAIIEGLDIVDDQQHLDVAAGTGEPDLTIAKLAPNGSVVLTNLAAEVVAGEATCPVR